MSLFECNRLQNQTRLPESKNPRHDRWWMEQYNVYIQSQSWWFGHRRTYENAWWSFTMRFAANVLDLLGSCISLKNRCPHGVDQ